MTRLKKLTAHVLVCTHKTCLKQGAKESAKELKHALRDGGLRRQVMVTEVDCLDQCGDGPVMVIYPDGVWYKNVGERCARQIVAAHFEPIAGEEFLGEHVLHRITNKSPRGKNKL